MEKLEYDLGLGQKAVLSLSQDLDQESILKKRENNIKYFANKKRKMQFTSECDENLNSIENSKSNLATSPPTSEALIEPLELHNFDTENECNINDNNLSSILVKNIISNPLELEGKELPNASNKKTIDSATNVVTINTVKVKLNKKKQNTEGMMPCIENSSEDSNRPIYKADESLKIVNLEKQVMKYKQKCEKYKNMYIKVNKEKDDLIKEKDHLHNENVLLNDIKKKSAIIENYNLELQGQLSNLKELFDTNNQNNLNEPKYETYNGIKFNSALLHKIRIYKKDSMYIKHLARELWTEEELAQRSLTGKPCNIQKGSENNLNKRPLTPQKVQAITMLYDERIMNQQQLCKEGKRNTSIKLRLNTILTEYCFDRAKKLKKEKSK